MLTCPHCQQNVANPTKETEAMRRSILRCQRQLACIAAPDGNLVSEAESVSGGALRFETLHMRSIKSDTIRLSHLLMPFVGASRGPCASVSTS